ncbi:hypothetical protein RND71_031317 [Anisodus tanguticus]|uniref:Uncharacterized protein n=1 Tax=Anisodus tanguticus TaxID=243964 RepID=A0AAE1UYS4_9SOLA|nr:hypothetical protein RND71_031317 [Anisodus tanguticus]
MSPAGPNHVYQNFDLSNGYVHERVVDQVHLKRNFRDIYNQIKRLSWNVVFENPGPVNIDRVSVFYLNMEKVNSEFWRPTVPLRNILLTAATLCEAIGAPDDEDEHSADWGDIDTEEDDEEMLHNNDDEEEPNPQGKAVLEFNATRNYKGLNDKTMNVTTKQCGAMEESLNQKSIV